MALPLALLERDAGRREAAHQNRMQALTRPAVLSLCETYLGDVGRIWHRPGDSSRRDGGACSHAPWVCYVQRLRTPRQRGPGEGGSGGVTRRCSRDDGASQAMGADIDALSAPKHRNAMHLLWALVPALAIGLLAGWAAVSQSWAALGIRPRHLSFRDLRGVTHNAECVWDPNWMVGAGCDPFNRPYNLPSFWAKGSALLGINQDSTEIIGLSFIVIFALCVGAIAAVALRDRPPMAIVILMTAAVVSPPALLLLERGNVDVVIFLLLTASALLYLWRARLASGATIAIAALLKLYPIGAAPMLLIDQPRRKLVLAAFAMLIAIDAILLAPELAAIAATTPSSTGAAFGSAVLPNWLSPMMGFPRPDPALARGIGFSLFLLIFSIVAVIMLRTSWPVASSWSRLSGAIHADRTASVLVLLGGGTIVMAYLVGASWDYRLVFLIPLIAGLARVDWKRSRLAIPLAVVLVAQLWVTFQMRHWQFASDVVWLFLAPLLAFLVVHLAMLFVTSSRKA